MTDRTRRQPAPAASGKKFEYKKRSSEDLERRTNQSSNDRDTFLSSKMKVFSPKDGDYLLRILPPTWKDPDHYGLDLYVHYQVGADRGQFVCLDKHGKGGCPICAEKANAEAEGDKDYAKALSPAKRVLLYVINRDEEDAGVQVWAAPWTFDRDLSLLCKDKRSGEILSIDDPYEGYDIEFTRKGSGRKTEYVGISVARSATPISNKDDELDEWLDYITEHPLDTIYEMRDAEHIAKAFNGGAGMHPDERAAEEARREEAKKKSGGRDRARDRDDKDSGRGGRDRDRDDKDSGSSRRARDGNKSNELTADSVLEMSEAELDKLCEDKNINLYADEFSSVADWAKAIVSELGLDKSPTETLRRQRSRD